MTTITRQTSPERNPSATGLPDRAALSVLVVHNFYREPGGEDQVFEAETALLERHGHRVVRYTRHNDHVREGSPLSLATATVWNRETHRELRELLRHERPTVAHFHNTLPLVSPAAYYACRAEGVPVVQTLHNYRLVCPKATLLREGRVCEDCVGRAFPWPAVRHACYRDNRGATAAVAAMLLTHRAAGTYRRAVDRYIALTEFARSKLVEGGLPADRIVVKPNFLQESGEFRRESGDFALYVGRLASEKGVDVMLRAWRRLDGGPALRIVGDGPLADEVADAAASLPNVEWLGRRPHDEVLELMRRAAFLVFPSVWYEGFPMTLVEAFSCGLPIVTSRLGSMEEIVDDRDTGLHFTPGDDEELAERARWLWERPEVRSGMEEAARGTFERRYSAEVNYRLLLDVYEEVLRDRELPEAPR